MNNDYNGFINEIYADGIREFFAGGSSADFPVLLCVAGGLLILAVMLLTALYVLRNHTVRIYNWNGKRYCYLGRAGLRREGRLSCEHRGADGGSVLHYLIPDLSVKKVCPQKPLQRYDASCGG